jgi:hypothetical protein
MSGAQKASPAGFQTACLIKAGTLLNIWPYFHHVMPAIASARSGKLCVLDLLEQKIDGDVYTHACIAARLRVIP